VPRVGEANVGPAVTPVSTVATAKVTVYVPTVEGAVYKTATGVAKVALAQLAALTVGEKKTLDAPETYSSAVIVIPDAVADTEKVPPSAENAEEVET
jgi:hypothetical protein